MRDEPNAHYVTKQEFAGHASVIWMFIMFILMIMISGAGQLFQVVLFVVSLLMAVAYMLTEKPLFRRKRRPKD